MTGTRRTNPAISLEELPSVDAILLSHYHADHFDEEVEKRLRRDLPIVTTEHAKESLVDKKEEGKFEKVVGLKTWEECVVCKEGSDGKKAIKIRAMPGKHVPDGIVGTLNDWVGAVSGWCRTCVESGSWVTCRCRPRMDTWWSWEQWGTTTSSNAATGTWIYTPFLLTFFQPPMGTSCHDHN